MIENYLKTGMSVCDDPTINMYHYPDYDAIKGCSPHNLNDCCETMFCQFTDSTHFPSFQIRVPHNLGAGYTNAWFHQMSDWGTTNDGTSVGLTLPLDVYNTVDGCVVSHDFRDAVTYPAGHNHKDCFYLVIEVGSPSGPGYHKYITQPFKICDCEASVIDRKIVGNSEAQAVHITNTNANPEYTFGYGRFTPIYYYNNKTYNVWMDKGDSRAHIWA